jgi:hypothetical protein
LDLGQEKDLSFLKREISYPIIYRKTTVQNPTKYNRGDRIVCIVFGALMLRIRQLFLSSHQWPDAQYNANFSCLVIGALMLRIAPAFPVLRLVL